MADSHEHKCWMNHRAHDFVQDTEMASRRLRDVVRDGAKLRETDLDELQFISDRILKIMREAKADD